MAKMLVAVRDGDNLEQSHPADFAHDTLVRILDRRAGTARRPLAIYVKFIACEQLPARQLICETRRLERGQRRWARRSRGRRETGGGAPFAGAASPPVATKRVLFSNRIVEFV